MTVPGASPPDAPALGGLAAAERLGIGAEGWRQAIAGGRLAIAVEIVMVGVWFVLRTVGDVQGAPYVAWNVVAWAIALASPTSGLVILLATIPFYEPGEVSQSLGLRHLLIAVLGLAVALRVAAGGWRSIVWTAPLRVAIGLGAVTLLGVANTWRLFPQAWAWHSTHFWLAAVGGALILFWVGVWVAATGVRRHVLVVIVSATAAVTLALFELFVPGSITSSVVSWIGFWKGFPPRLSGPIASPNAMAALAVMPVCILTAVAVLGRRDVGIRLLAAAGAAVLMVAMYVTYSRAALLALFALAVVVGWRLHRILGIVLLVTGIAGGLALLPAYLDLRAGTGVSAVQPGTLLVATDTLRINAWGAAIAMWSDQPILGQGFLSYKQVADAFGDTVLSSPHNEWLRLFAEEGIVGGLLGLAFVATTLSWLSHGRGPLLTGIFAGAIGYFLMASFNNPLLYVQISAVVFPLISYALVTVSRTRARETVAGAGVVSDRDSRPPLGSSGQ